MKYKIIIDKQPRTNPSSEKREYEIDIEELRCKGNVYDSLVITKDEDYIMRRLSLSEYHVLSVLDKPVKEPLNDVNIELFEGDNYIYLVDMTGNKFYAEYLIKSDFNDIYATKNEMNSAINQNAQQIELTVNQKLTSYATSDDVEGIVTELNSTILQKADEITSTVSKSYTTKEELNTAKSEIKQTTDNITSTVSKKVGNNEIISKINQSSEKIDIDASKININGAISANGNFKVDINGNMICNNATITGGTIGIEGGSQNDPKFSINNGANSVRFFPTGLWIYSGSDGGDSGIIIDRENGSPHISIGQVNSPTVLYQTYMKCKDYQNYSKLESKENVEKFNKNALEIIKNTDIYEYDYKDSKKEKKKIGIIIDKDYKYSKEITDDEESSVNLYSMISVAYKAIQQLSNENEELKQRIEKLEQEVSKNV